MGDLIILLRNESQKVSFSLHSLFHCGCWALLLVETSSVHHYFYGCPQIPTDRSSCSILLEILELICSEQKWLIWVMYTRKLIQEVRHLSSSPNSVVQCFQASTTYALSPKYLVHNPNQGCLQDVFKKVQMAVTVMCTKLSLFFMCNIKMLWPRA